MSFAHDLGGAIKNSMDIVQWRTSLVAASYDHVQAIYYFNMQDQQFSQSTTWFVVGGLAATNDSLYVLEQSPENQYIWSPGQLAIRAGNKWLAIPGLPELRAIASDGKTLWAVSQDRLFHIQGKKVLRGIALRPSNNDVYSLFAINDRLFMSCMQPDNDNAFGGGFYEINKNNGDVSSISLPHEFSGGSVYSVLPTANKDTVMTTSWDGYELSPMWRFNIRTHAFTPGGKPYFSFYELTSRSAQPDEIGKEFLAFAKKLRQVGFFQSEGGGIDPDGAGNYWELAYEYAPNDFKKEVWDEVRANNPYFPPMFPIFNLHRDQWLWQLAANIISQRPLPADAGYFIIAISLWKNKNSEEVLKKLINDKTLSPGDRLGALRSLLQISVPDSQAECRSLLNDLRNNPEVPPMQIKYARKECHL
ncbi:MAG TPA: hypothetical protein VNH15_03875 [Elusimicrobiota bacterium]|nr:hypothetical protein [Elusimicrobiota bacterium]